MHLALGQFDKAVENFRKANEANSSATCRALNLGVVYAYDLKQPKKAIEAQEGRRHGPEQRPGDPGAHSSSKLKTAQ